MAIKKKKKKDHSVNHVQDGLEVGENELSKLVAEKLWRKAYAREMVKVCTDKGSRIMALLHCTN